MTRGESLRRAAKLSKDKAISTQSLVQAFLLALLSFSIFAGDLTELFRSDRLAHFLVTCVLTQSYFLLTPQRRFQTIEAIVLVLSIGAFKEVMDHQWEFLDLAMNLFGTVFAAGLNSCAKFCGHQSIPNYRA